jgi:hypothetical protein
MLLFDIELPKLYPTNISCFLALYERGRLNTLYLLKHCKEEFLYSTFIFTPNTIASLIMHIAAFEVFTQKITFQARVFSNEEENYWMGAEPGKLQPELIKGFSKIDLLNRLQEARKSTLDLFKAKDDTWLKATNIVYRNSSNYYLWFHAMEDELNHVGQIKTMMALLIKNG